MKPRVVPVLAILSVVLITSSCISKWADVGPGGVYVMGRKATITGHSYDEIWMAAYTVADEHFEIREQDKSRGVIRAERMEIVGMGGARVGISIVPPVTGVNQYVIEVVVVPRNAYDPAQQDWEQKVLRDVHRVLEGEPIR